MLLLVNVVFRLGTTRMHNTSKDLADKTAYATVITECVSFSVLVYNAY